MEKEESIQEIFKKRVLKYILVLVFFSLAYYVFLATHDQSSIDLNWILRTIYTSTSFSYMGSYWFLYSYIVFLLMLPFLQVLAKYITKELVKYLLILNALLTGVLPVLEFYLGLGSFAISIPIATNYVMFYPIMGYYIEKNEINYANNKKLCLTVGIMSVFSIITSMLLSIKSLKNGNVTENYLTLFSGFLVILVYLFIAEKCKNINKNIVLERVIREIARCTFGIYLLHGFVFTCINDIYTGGRYIDAWIKVVFVFSISLVLTFILRRIPVIKRLF